MRAVMDERSLPEGSGILKHPEGVDFIPSNIELSGIETGLVNMMSREYVLCIYKNVRSRGYSSDW